MIKYYICIIFWSYLKTCSALFSVQPRAAVRNAPACIKFFMSSTSNDDPIFKDTAIYDKISALIASHPILVFMKGDRFEPQCGYSRTVVQILNQLRVPYMTVDVMADDKIRQGIKSYSDWPTIPQVYLSGEFIGGADIIIELYQNGELQEAVEVAAAS